MLKMLSTPLKLGSVEIKNRFIVSAMAVNCCNEDGTATEKFIAYHEEKAKGGWGLIVTEDIAIDPSGKTYPNLPGLWCDEQIPSFTELTKRVHAAGGKIFAQIFHGGRQTQEWITHQQVLAPSAIPCPVKKDLPRALTVEEVEALVEKFGDAALRAKKAGFDGVQIHGAHGYLVNEFTSHYSNKRIDKYGGNLVNRMRFPVEIIENIRSKCGEAFPIDYKISGEERVDGGNNIEDTKAMAMILEKAGISSLNVSVGVYESWTAQVPPAAMGHGWISDLACQVKKVVDIPVTTVGRINDPIVAEGIIRSGKADACYMARASLADPRLPEKALSGHFEDIIYCIGCLQGCVKALDANQAAGCTLNPRSVRENEYPLTPAPVKKNVFVAGAGPAGCEAAIIMAQRGHKVTVFEKTDCIGGMYKTAAVPPTKGEITSFIVWQKTQMEKLGVDIRFNTELTKEMIETETPDAVVVATGCHQFVPPFPGKDREFVKPAVEFLNGEFTLGGNIAVIGGGLVGGETANHLASHGNKVTIIEMLPEVDAEAPGGMKEYLMASYEKHGVELLTSTAVQAINEDHTITVKSNNEEKVIGPFDYVVTAVGLHSNTELKNVLEDVVKEVVYVGGARKSGDALAAIREGYDAGYRV